MNKDQVFQIMGKFYGNAYYESAIRLGISESDLQIVVELLDEFNKLGYCFSNLSALNYKEDLRFPPIIIEQFGRFQSLNYQVNLISAIHFRSYSAFVPQLIELYKKSDSQRIREAIGQDLLSIRSKDYIAKYLSIVNNPGYGQQHDFIMDLLCELRVVEVCQRLIELYAMYPHEWSWTLLRYAHIFHNAQLTPIVSTFLESEDAEFRSMARKTLKKINSER